MTDPHAKLILQASLPDSVFSFEGHPDNYDKLLESGLRIGVLKSKPSMRITNGLSPAYARLKASMLIRMATTERRGCKLWKMSL
jgi:hypothetical protein